MAGDEPALGPPSQPGSSGAPEFQGAGGVSDDDRASVGMEIGRQINRIFVEESADPSPPDDDAPADASPGEAFLLEGRGSRRRRARRRRTWSRAQQVAFLLGVLVILGGVAITGALLFIPRGGDGSPSTPGGGAAPAAQPAPAPVQPRPTATADALAAQDTPPATWRFTGKYGLDVTITLVAEGDGYGRVSVKGEPDAKGGYTWSDSTLKMAYRQPVTLLNGKVVDTKGRFTCKGRPTSAKLRCAIRALAWTSTSTTQNGQWLRLAAIGRPVE